MFIHLAFAWRVDEDGRDTAKLMIKTFNFGKIAQAPEDSNVSVVLQDDVSSLHSPFTLSLLPPSETDIVH